MWDSSDLISAFSAVATAIAAVLIYVQIRSDRRWNRLNVSHDILNDFVSGVIEDATEELRETYSWDVLHSDMNYQQLLKSMEAKGNGADVVGVDKILRRIFRRFEAICISMHNEIVKEEVCKEYIFSILIRFFQSSEAFVKKERELRSEPKIFEFVEYYAKRWQQLS